MPSRRAKTLPLVAFLLLLAPAPRAQEHEHRGLAILPDEEDEASQSWWDTEAFAGAWEGVQGGLDALGAELTVNVVTDTSWPLSGGVRQRRTARTLFDAALEVDLEQAAGIPNATLFAEFYSLSGRDASDDVGDAQAFSNIDGEHVAQLAELWFEQSFVDDALRLKVGKVDANSEFAHANAGLEFLHSSAGFSPTNFALPTYPDPAVSLNLFARPSRGWQVGLGVYNAEDGGAVSGRRGLTAQFESAFVIGQIDRAWERAGGGRLAVGLWHHSGEFARFGGGTDSAAEGVYALLEQRLARERSSDEAGLTGFLQWGAADDEVSEIEAHLGAGLVYAGLVPERDSWLTGLYFSLADFTGAPAAGLGGTELAVELFQEFRLFPTLTLKPDLQLIVDPSGSDQLDDVWVATLRIELSL